MTEIAAAAELSRATLYSMFTGKEELYQEVVSTAAAAVRDAVRQKVESLDDPAQQLLCVIDSLFSCYEEDENLLRIYALGTHGLPFKIRDTMGDSVLEIFVAFTEWVIRDREARQARRLPPAASTPRRWASRWWARSPPPRCTGSRRLPTGHSRGRLRP